MEKHCPNCSMRISTNQNLNLCKECREDVFEKPDMNDEYSLYDPYEEDTKREKIKKKKRDF